MPIEFPTKGGSSTNKRAYVVTLDQVSRWSNAEVHRFERF